MRAIYILKVIFSSVIACLLAVANSFAQDDPLPEWIKRQNIEQRLTSLGNGLMGDQIDPATGTLVFKHVDVDIPGNFALPVRIERKRTMGPRYVEGVDVEFADWELVVPKISAATVNEGGWYSNGNRCSGAPDNLFPTVQTGQASYMTAQGYNNGIHMSAPGAGGRELLYINSKAPLNATADSPEFPANAEYVTTDNWYFTCISAMGGGQGLLGHSPNGDKYYFDRVIKRETDNGRYSNISYTPSHDRYSVMLMATKVEDVHGNYVDYTYDSSTDRLTKIEASDGRKITLAYSGELISSVTSNPGVLSPSGTSEQRTWSYAYRDTTIQWPYWTTRSGLRDNKVLEKVTQPDGLFWDFDLDNMSIPSRPSEPCVNYGVTMNLTHPYGASGTFRVEPRDFRIGNTDLIRYHHNICDPFNEITPGAKTQYIKKSAIYSYAVEFKTIVNAGESNTWTYAYGEDKDNFLNITTMTDPEGSKTRFEHYFNWLGGISPHPEKGGKLKRKQYLDNANTALRTEELDWTSDGEIGWVFTSLNAAPKTMRGLQDEFIITQDGDTYTTEMDYNTDKTLGDYSYGLPVETRIFSNFDTTPRVTETSYIHLTTSPWIIGLPDVIDEGVAGDMRELVDYDYDLTSGLKTSQTTHGTSQVSFGYSNLVGEKGALILITDALTRKIAASSWHRGKPQSVTSAAFTPEAVTIGRDINADGWIMGQTDGRSFVTDYERDDMGRLTLIDPPSTWDNTSIVYDFSGGGVIQTITKGQSKQTVTYDSLFRPILEHQQDLSSTWSSYVNTTYDALGRVAFQSQPSINAAEAKGTNTEYDALGRVTSIAENVAPLATTLTSYLSGNRKRVTDPSGAWTDYIASGYDGPGGDDIRSIYRGEGVDTYLQQTDITKNIWGEMTQLRQWGDLNGHAVDHSQYFYYDPITYRLCRHYAPEHGATLYEYDDAGQMKAYAKGQPNSGCTVPTNNSRVNVIYDDLGRIETTNFNDPDTPDIVRSYDDNGNVLTVNRGSGTSAVNWIYSYNELNMPTSELLTLDGEAFGIDYSYNTAGHLTNKFLPSGRQITYTPDGLGRHKTITTGNLTLASNVGYHPSGAVSAMLYGNGQQFTQTLNDRLLPQQMLSAGNGLTALDQNYSYDPRGKIIGITDGAVTGNSRSYSYDGLGQLTSATSGSWWGEFQYEYDSLGNQHSRTLPFRSQTTVYDPVKNRLIESNDSFVSNGLGNRAIGYDTRGNVTSIGLTTFEYDMSDQPVVVSGQTPAGAPTNGNYVYDGNLKRVKAVVNGQTHYNVYDLGGSLVHVESVNDNKITDYVSGPKGSLARITNDAVTYLHADHLGTAQAGTNETGALEWRQHYTPFGYALTSPAANDNLAGFTGHIKDKATGLNYMQARYYDPTIGRFLSVDPVTFMDTEDPRMFNRYAYTFNDPVNLIDPDGNKPDHIMDRQMAGIAKTGRAIGIFSKHHRHAKEMTATAEARGDSSADHGDKFEHFMANHEVVSEMGEEGAEIAEMLGDAREDLQSAAAWLKGKENTGGKADQKANAAGRESARNGENGAEAGEAFVRDNFNPDFEARNEDTLD